jgi:hypothetical protein
MTPGLLTLLILTPPWIALIFFSMKRSFNVAALATVPVLALLCLIIPLSANDDLLRGVLSRVTAIYMLLVAFLAAMGLVARFGVHVARRRGADLAPSDGRPPEGGDSTQPKA